jgi:hypothetical protein
VPDEKAPDSARDGVKDERKEDCAETPADNHP